MNKGGSIAGYYVEICKFFKLHLKPLFLFEQGIFIQERKECIFIFLLLIYKTVGKKLVGNEMTNPFKGKTSKIILIKSQSYYQPYQDYCIVFVRKILIISPCLNPFNKPFYQEMQNAISCGFKTFLRYFDFLNLEAV